MKKSNLATLLLVVALALCALTRLWILTKPSLHVDEAYTFDLAARPWATMLADIAKHDYHPPLFYAFTHGAMGLFHWPLVDYRWLSAPLDLLTVLATWAIGRRLFGDVVGGIGALVVALDPSLVLWDRVYRMYAPLTALVVISWWALAEVSHANDMRRQLLWALFVVCAILQPYVHYIGIVNLACQTLYSFVRGRAMRPAIVAAVIALLAFIPWFGALRMQYAGGGLVAGTASLPVYWWTIARDAIAAGTPLGWLNTPAFGPLFTLAVVACCVWAAWIARATLLPFWLAVALVQVVITLATGKFLIVPRYLLPVVPAFGLSVGLVVQYLLNTRARVAGVAVSVAVLAFFALCTTNVTLDPFYQFPDWNVVNNIVSSHETANDAMVLDQGYSFEALKNYRAFRDRDVAAPASASDTSATLEWLKAHARQRVWYVENQYYFVDPDRRIIGALQVSRPRIGEWLEARAELSNRVYVALFGAERSETKNPQSFSGSGLVGTWAK